MKKQAIALMTSFAVCAGSLLPAMAINGTSIQRTQNAASVTMPADVSSNVWYWNAAQYVLSYDLMSQINGSFAGATSLTREQIAQILYRDAMKRGMPASATQNSLSGITDASSIGSDYKTGVSYCVANGVLVGDAKKTLHPKNRVTRQELATMLMRYGFVLGLGNETDIESPIVDTYTDSASIASWARDGVAYSAINDLMQGSEENQFLPTGNITRAQFAQTLLNLDNKVSAVWSRLTDDDDNS